LQTTVTSGSIAVVCGGLFVLAWAAAPRHGVLAKAMTRWKTTRRIVGEDILGLLYRLEESKAEAPGDLRSALQQTLGASRSMVTMALRRLRARNLIQATPKQVVLTESGRREARQLVRSHRLWESYLHKILKRPADQLHQPAHLLEHVTGPQLREELARRTEGAQRDPHDKPIPPETNGASDDR
ncbi:MAG: metal-dependent transcriptional regulator, partial [Phycisphaeraceae bacterium]|nr:metal-dependent transcriptional regulator [Phycisphaeraceae bacterium]